MRLSYVSQLVSGIVSGLMMKKGWIIERKVELRIMFVQFSVL